MIEIECAALPQHCVLEAFTLAHLPTVHDRMDAGAALQVVGLPLGFHDLLHHLPMVCQAVIASSYGPRFQGTGSS